MSPINGKKADESLSGRSPYEGIKQVFKFNWPYYLLSSLVIGASIVFLIILDSQGWKLLLLGVLLTSMYFTLASVVASHWIYDRSGFFELQWFQNIMKTSVAKIANIHAGLDEITQPLSLVFPKSKIDTFSFFDPAINTEPSIARAQGKQMQKTGKISLADLQKKIDSNQRPSMILGKTKYDFIFLPFSIHEVRSQTLRIALLNALAQSLAKNGSIIFAEQLQSLPNFLAFAHGAFHFYSKNTWQACFQESNLKVQKEIRLNPFTYIVQMSPN